MTDYTTNDSVDKNVVILEEILIVHPLVTLYSPEGKRALSNPHSAQLSEPSLSFMKRLIVECYV